MFLENICNTLRSTLNLNQRENTKAAKKWFLEISNRSKCSFIQVEIKISIPQLLESYLTKHETELNIDNEKIKIIKYCQKLFLIHQNSIWTKKKKY